MSMLTASQLRLLLAFIDWLENRSYTEMDLAAWDRTPERPGDWDIEAEQVMEETLAVFDKFDSIPATNVLYAIALRAGVDPWERLSDENGFMFHRIRVQLRQEFRRRITEASCVE